MVNILAVLCVFTLTFVGSIYANVVATRGIFFLNYYFKKCQNFTSSLDCGEYMFVGDSVVIDGPFHENCIFKFETQEDRVLVFSLIDGSLKEAEEYFSVKFWFDSKNE